MDIHNLLPRANYFVNHICGKSRVSLLLYYFRPNDSYPSSLQFLSSSFPSWLSSDIITNRRLLACSRPSGLPSLVSYVLCNFYPSLPPLLRYTICVPSRVSSQGDVFCSIFSPSSYGSDEQWGCPPPLPSSPTRPLPLSHHGPRWG